MTTIKTPLRLIACLLLALSTSWALGQSADVETRNPEELQSEKIDVDERIFREEWNEVPFDSRYFTYTPEQIRERWDHLMRGIRAPYPSLDLIAYTVNNYPTAVEDVDPALRDDPQRYHDEVIDTWRLFFAGRYQRAREQGKQLGFFGLLPGAFSQVLYGIYLADRKSTKDMLLQDVLNTVERYDNVTDRMRDDDRPGVREMAVFNIMGRVYAMGRIAEEAPVPVAVARGYLRKVKESADQALAITPDHPLALALVAGIDSGIMRRVGKFTGRLTYGARATNVEEAFAQALELVPDMAILQYEYANSLIYMNRKRELNSAMRHLEKATQTPPNFAMEALDAMYAYKRLQEIRLYALNYRSFRDFEKDRFAFTRVSDRNLMSVLTPTLNMDMLKNPDQYRVQ